MNSSQKIQIKINPKDLYKISPDLILNINLKNGYIVILDDSIPSQEVNELFNNHKKENNKNKNIVRNYNQSLNFGMANSYLKDNINGKSLEINDSFLFNNRDTINKSNNHYSPNPNNSINKENQIENKDPNVEQMKNFKSQNQSNKSISDLVNEKLQKKFHSFNNSSKLKKFRTTINSEININIKGNDSKKKFDNSLLKEFDELLLNFNGIKKGLFNQEISNNSKKKYILYKKLNSKKNERLLLDDLSGISPNTKAIKYIARNEQKNNVTIAHDLNGNTLMNRNNNRLSFLKEKTLKRNKSNNLYLFKNQRTITDIISPPNHLPYNKIFILKK